MIHIEKDQEILEDKNIRVLTASGNYEDQALIEFYDISNPELIAGSFQAQYIKYGNLVYQFNDPKQLGEEILKIDPESTHTAASYVRMTNELLAQMNGGSLEPESLDEVISNEQQMMENKIEESLGESFDEPLPEEEILEEESVLENVSEDEVVEEEILPEIENPIEENILEEVTPESLREEVITPEIIDTEVIPETGSHSSLSEEIISYARNRKSNKLKIKNRA